MLYSHSLDNKYYKTDSFAKLFLSVVFIALLSILAGYNILFETTDSLAYKEFYDSIDAENPLGLSTFEFGFQILAYCGKMVFHLSYYHWITCLIFISLSLKFFVFSKFKNSILILIIYTFILFPYYECLVVRASLAQAIVFFALVFFHKSTLKYVILICFASLFHISMILFILPIILKRITSKNLSLKQAGAIFFLFLIGKSLIVLILLNLEKFAPYYYENPSYFNIWGLPRVAIILSCWYYILRKSENKTNIFLSNLLILFTLFSFSIFEFSMMSIRVLDLVLPLYFILLFDKFKKRNINLVFVYIFLLGFELFFTRIIDGPQFVLKLIK
jgi:hypothetical protein